MDFLCSLKNNTYLCSVKIKQVKPFKQTTIMKYFWKAESNDGAFEDESRKMFRTMKECYNDMRNAALEKAKWNTEFSDFDDMEEGDYIGYHMKFFKDKIIHESYSGIYTYTIKKYKELEDMDRNDKIDAIIIAVNINLK